MGQSVSAKYVESAPVETVNNVDSSPSPAKVEIAEKKTESTLVEPHLAIVRRLKRKLKKQSSAERLENFVRFCVDTKRFIELKELDDGSPVMLYFEHKGMSQICQRYLLCSTRGEIYSRNVVTQDILLDENSNLGVIIEFLFKSKQYKTLQHLLTIDRIRYMFHFPEQTNLQIAKALGEPMLFWKDLLALYPSNTTVKDN